MNKPDMSQVNRTWLSTLAPYLLTTAFDRFDAQMRTFFNYHCQRRNPDGQDLFTIKIAHVSAADTYRLATNEIDEKEAYRLVEYSTFRPTFDSEEGKYGEIRRIAQNMAESYRMPVAIYIATETWISTGEQGQPHIEPRLDPNRQEGAMIMALTMTHESRLEPKLIQLTANGYRLVPKERPGDLVKMVPHILEAFYRFYAEIIQRRVEAAEQRLHD